ncbi:MAG TPA: energy transducer TonB [Rhodanobacteraceae bacterium]|nr:energy transducer TonB [Rhodanobacteraceae bacterium]
MITLESGRSEWRAFGPAAGLRGVAVIMGMALLLAGCGKGQQASSTATRTGAKPATSAAVKPAPASAPATLPAQSPAGAASAAQAQQQAAAAATAKLTSMSVSDLLAAAREAYAGNRVVAPAGNNAMEYYEAVLAKQPDNQVAKDALRETFPFGVPDVDKAIAQNNFTDAGREIDVLAKADPTNYTLTLLRSKLDAQKKLQARQQQQAQLQAQAAAQLAAAQQTAAKQAAAQQAAAQQAAAAKAAAEQQAAKLAAQQQAAAKTAARNEVATTPEGKTRDAVVVSAVPARYPITAAREQISGYAVVEFTVATDGSVENPHVVDSKPRRVFDRAAVQAIERYKFKPAVKDGQPVASVVRRTIDFKFGG